MRGNCEIQIFSSGAPGGGGSSVVFPDAHFLPFDGFATREKDVWRRRGPIPSLSSGGGLDGSAFDTTSRRVIRVIRRC